MPSMILNLWQGNLNNFKFRYETLYHKVKSSAPLIPPFDSHAGLIMVVLSTGKHLCGNCLLIKKNNFIYLLFLAALGLCRCVGFVVFGCVRPLSLCGLSSSCGERGLLSGCGMQSSHCGGFSCYGAQALGPVALAVAAHGLSGCGAQV